MAVEALFEPIQTGHCDAKTLFVMTPWDAVQGGRCPGDHTELYQPGNDGAGHIAKPSATFPRREFC